MAESIFEKKSIGDVYGEIQKQYLSDNRPWIIGFSGGKDSTCLAQLVWNALSKLDKELDAKIEQSSTIIEKNKNESVLQIQNQINEITKLTLSKVASFDVSDDEIKSAIKSTERSIN